MPYLKNDLAVRLDLPVTSLSISPTNQQVVLAAKKGLYIIDLDRPFDPPRFLQHVSKWEVSDVMWNPHHSRKEWIASTSNQKLVIWNLNETENAVSRHVQYILHEHSRAISDLNWSFSQPETIATCSYDSFVHIWDLRASSSKPTASFSAFTVRATQVKWNKKNEYLIAASHETDVRVWDIRKGSLPLTLITAHMSKIHGIDWSWDSETKLVTCAQDKTVKFWDISQPRQVQATIQLDYPVWRARHTPFGHGLVTMPLRNKTELLLWNLNNLQGPVHTFSGHSDTPREFVWRSRGNEYQLVTWSKDQHLRLWSVPQKIVAAVESEADSVTEQQVETSLNSLELEFVDSPQDLADIFRDDFSEIQQQLQIINSQPINLEQEVALLTQKYPQVQIQLDQRLVSIILQSKVDNDIPLNAVQSDIAVATALLRLQIQVPLHYPAATESPIFEISKSGMISMAKREFLSRNLNEISLKYIANGQCYLQPCIQYLLTGSPDELNLKENPVLFTETMEEDSLSDTSSVGLLDNAENVASLLLGGARQRNLIRENQFLKDKINARDTLNVPFPCLCGAQFSQMGDLVIFNQSHQRTKFKEYPKSYFHYEHLNFSSKPPESARVTVPTFNKTLNSIDFLLRDDENELSSDEEDSEFYKSHKLSSLFRTPREIRTRHSIAQPKQTSHSITQSLIIPNEVPRQRSLSISSEAISTPQETPIQSRRASFDTTPKQVTFTLGSIESTMELEKVEKAGSRTVAILDLRKILPVYPIDYQGSLANSSLEQAKKLGKTDIVKVWEMVKILEESIECKRNPVKTRRRRTPEMDFNLQVNFIDQDPVLELVKDKALQYLEQVGDFQNYSILEGKNQLLNASFADYLSSLGEYNLAAEFRNSKATDEANLTGQCPVCKCSIQFKKSSFCSQCERKIAIDQHCVICAKKCNGNISFCAECGHGGHVKHLEEWFETEKECPSGCGCPCLSLLL